jgi:hypothetical protein
MLQDRMVAVSALFSLMACGCRLPSSTPSPDASSAGAVASQPSPSASMDPLALLDPANATPADSFFSEADLLTLGFKVERLTDTMTLACGRHRQLCICLEPLVCTKAQPCSPLDENLRLFQRALDHPTEGRTVSCEWAETGTCGALRYFDFEGDTDRFELRFFGAGGKLVAQHNWTDYNEYCSGRASSRWRGGIPRCYRMQRDKVICGTRDAGLFALSPAEDLRTHRTGGPSLGPF